MSGTIDGNKYLVDLVIADMNTAGLNFLPYKNGMTGGYRVALVVNPGVDYHWYRDNGDGTWSHKSGQTAVTKKEVLGAEKKGNIVYGDVITDSKSAAQKAGYTVLWVIITLHRKNRSLRMKKIFSLLLSIMLLFASGCESNLIEKSEKDETAIKNDELFSFPGGGFATYKYIDRDLSLNDFVKIKIGTTYKEIKDILGEPNGILGSGVQWPFYETSDKSYVILYTGLESDSELFNIRIVDSSGRVFELKQDE